MTNGKCSLSKKNLRRIECVGKNRRYDSLFKWCSTDCIRRNYEFNTKAQACQRKKFSSKKKKRPVVKINGHKDVSTPSLQPVKLPQFDADAKAICQKQARIYRSGKCEFKCINPRAIVSRTSKKCVIDSPATNRVWRGCLKRGRVYESPRCLKKCAKGDDYFIEKSYCKKKNKRKIGCIRRGRVYENNKCTRRCVNGEYHIVKSYCV